MNIVSKGYRFRRGTGSPFDAVSHPTMDLGSTAAIPVQWCHKCNMAVETRGESFSQAQVYGQKHWCKRCGAVTASAVYYSWARIDEQPTELCKKALIWSNTNESKG